MLIAIHLLLFSLGSYAQYLASEPPVAALLEGIRYCAMEPMVGVEKSRGLQWLKDVRSGDQSCAQNVALIEDEKGNWVVYQNSAKQIRALRIEGRVGRDNVDRSTCQKLQLGESAPDFDIRQVAERVALQQRRILLESEAARPARTREDRLQFALCHGALSKLLDEYKLRKVLSRAENDRLTLVHRGPNPSLLGPGGGSR